MLILLATIFIVITLVGVVGNTIVLVVIVSNRQLHDSTNILICNLALADLLFLAFCVPLTAYSYVLSWEFGESLCYWTVTLQYVTCYVSVWTLVLLAFDRFLSITYPTLQPSIRRGRWCIYVCVALWLLVSVLNAPNMSNAGLIPINEQASKFYCADFLGELNGASQLQARLYFWGFNVFAYLLPLSLSTVFYLLLVKALWKEKLTQCKNSQKIKRHATKMVFTVIMTFGFCWLPQQFRFFFRGLSYPHMAFWERWSYDLLFFVQASSQVLAYANSCVNPILYGVLSERFRLGVRQSWSRLTGQRRTSFDKYKSSMFTKNVFDGKTPSDSAPRSRGSPRGSTYNEIRRLVNGDCSSSTASLEDSRGSPSPPTLPRLTVQPPSPAPLPVLVQQLPLPFSDSFDGPSDLL